MPTTVIIWSFIVIFGISAILTLLGITGVIKTIKEKYLNALFAALILEVIAAVILVFKSYDFNPEDRLTFSSIIEEARVEYEAPDEAASRDYVLSSLSTAQLFPTLKSERDSLRGVCNQLTNELDGCTGSLSKLDQEFYTKIARLRTEANRFSGSINLQVDLEPKKNAYKLLEEIFIILGYEVDEQKDKFEQIRKLYRAFENRHGVLKAGKLLVVSEYDITLLLREYLNEYYPIK